MTHETDVSVSPLHPGALPELADEWRQLESRAGDLSPFLSFDWLSSWVDIYEPAGLRLVRARDGERATIALGLVETLSGRRWRFCGRPVTPERGLLCASGDEETAWAAFIDWTRRNPGAFAMLGAGGLPPLAALNGAVRSPKPVYVAHAPGSFDDYLAGLSSNTRSRVRRHQRKLAEAAGAIELVPESELRAALDAFVALHAERASDKGESHPGIDERLARLLEATAHSPRLRTRAHRLTVDGRLMGVVVHLTTDRTLYYYNLGWDPEAAPFLPGVLLVVASIEMALGEGCTVIDLGPGTARYKFSLGGEEVERDDVELWSTSPAGRALKLGLHGYRSARAQMERARERLRGGRE
jgi:CelD/BcsL family acetyltransferase involved in cellulose biosynthesis